MPFAREHRLRSCRQAENPHRRLLKRVSLGYFDEVKTGDILTGLTTELSSLELDGMKMIDRVLNGYVNMLAVTIFLGVFCPPAVLAVILGVAVSSVGIWGINRRSRKTAPFPIAQLKTSHVPP